MNAPREVTPSPPVFATSAPTLRITYTNAAGTPTSPSRVDIDVTNPQTGVTTAYPSIAATSTGVFEKQVTMNVAGRWIWAWKAYSGADVVLTDKFQMYVNS